MNKETVQQFISAGLDRASIERLVSAYEKGVAEKLDYNPQLLPARLEYFKSILRFWPGKK